MMKFYAIDTLGELDDPELCIIDSPPSGLGLKSYYLNIGKATAEIYPEDATVQMNPEEPGAEVKDFVGNTENCLIVTARLKSLLEKHCTDIEVEYLPLTLLNHDGDVHRDDLFIVNPIGSLDCLDRPASGVSYHDDGEILDIEDYVLDADKTRTAPSLFRLGEKADFYIIREDLLARVRGEGVENLLVWELEFTV